MAHSIAIRSQELQVPLTWAVNPGTVLRHAPLLGTAVLEFAVLITFLGVCIGLIAEFS